MADEKSFTKNNAVVGIDGIYFLSGVAILYNAPSF